MNQLFTRWTRFDKELSTWATNLVETRGGRWAAVLLAHSGDSQWWLIAGILFWWLGNMHSSETGKQIVIITLIAGVISGLLKQLFKRTRPNTPEYLLYLTIDRHSFPSGHATRVGALVVILSARLPLWGILALTTWAIGVGVSRIAMGVHFASDIIAGLLLGALLGCLMLVWWY
ncbi:MAG: phosphatase PAP2 family protein [Anaerolineales bacterium]|nr:phosphatase PAP2 family protein [Anaerolineales bacterium]